MKVKYREGRINVLDCSNVEDVLNYITSSEHEGEFFVCDINQIIFKYQLWRKQMPRIQPYYAVRCNNSDTVLRILSKLGVGFVCVSKSELQQVLSIGVDPSQIIFGHTMKFPTHIKFATENNVELMTFDSKEELRKIAKTSSNARVIIHIQNDLTVKTPFECKIGCNPHTEAEDLLKLAASLNINVAGVSFAIDSESDFCSINNSMAEARHLFTIAESMGHNFNLLRINGEHIRNPGGNDDVNNLSKELNLAVHEYFPDRRIKIILEDGSHFVRSAFKLASSIVGMKIRDDKYHYYINNGTFQNFNSIIYWNTTTLPRPLRKMKGEQFPSVLWGPTCDSIDILHNDVLLPKLKCGDWILFNNMGSYTLVLSTGFNGFGVSSIYYFINKENWLNLHKKLPISSINAIQVPTVPGNSLLGH